MNHGKAGLLGMLCANEFALKNKVLKKDDLELSANIDTLKNKILYNKNNEI